MKQIIAATVALAALAGCAGQEPPAIEYRTEVVIREVQKPCLAMADIPMQPAPVTSGEIGQFDDARDQVVFLIAWIIDRFGEGEEVPTAWALLRACARGGEE